MSIKSSAFGRVTLSGSDAEKFKKQVSYGKPKPAAVKGVKRGVEMLREMQANNGRVSFKIKRG